MATAGAAQWWTGVRMSAAATTKEQVYVAAVPLRASGGPPARLLMSAAYSLNIWDLQHFMVIVKNPSSRILVFDFQPQDPENPMVALQALSGRRIAGAVLVRELKNLPRRRCWFVGQSRVDDAVERAKEFSEGWGTELTIGQHDCRDYTNELVELLTGEKSVLENLRPRSYING